MVDSEERLYVAALIAMLAVAACGFAAVAAADHGSPANFTVQPQENEDRSPGAQDANYVMSSAGAEAFESDGLEVVDYYWLEAEQANFDDCSPDNARVFGIDRGNNNSGTQTDDDLLQHMKDYSIEGDRITLDLYDEDDIGDSTYLNPPDATIAVLADCIENTGNAGWYQFQGYVNGTTYDGGYEEIQLDSHYFWIGDFENEEEARQELGPPPSESGDAESESESESTPAPDEETESSDGDEAGDGGSDDAADEESSAESPEETDAGSATNDEETGEDGSGGDADGGTGDDGDGTEAGSGDATGDGDAGDDESTPASGDGPGFGAAAALLALLTGGALLNRRR